ncbi:hypothetical protein CSC64_08585, partial [Pseudoxanthomonas koreensis]
MPTYRQRGSTWRAEVFKSGRRESASFATKRQAVAWATQREAELVGARLPDHTLAEALRRFADEKCPGRKGGKWEQARLGAMQRDALAAVALPVLSRTDVAQWRDRRLQAVSGASVRREMNLLLAVLEERCGGPGSAPLAVSLQLFPVGPAERTPATLWSCWRMQAWGLRRLH